MVSKFKKRESENCKTPSGFISLSALLKFHFLNFFNEFSNHKVAKPFFISFFFSFFSFRFYQIFCNILISSKASPMRNKNQMILKSVVIVTKSLTKKKKADLIKKRTRNFF